MLVSIDHRSNRKTFLDAPTARLAVDFVNPSQRLNRFASVGNKESRLSVVDDLTARTEIHCNHGHTRRICFGKDKTEPLRDRIQVQQRARPGK
jgi:hypothetical protein